MRTAYTISAAIASGRPLPQMMARTRPSASSIVRVAWLPTIAQARWLALTRDELPAVAQGRHWPVRADHCFQRIFLDNACEGVWYDHIPGRPAYAHADRALLDRAIALAEEALAGTVSLSLLNRRSLAWRRQRAAG